MSRFDRFIDGLPDIPVKVARPGRQPNDATSRRARKVYGFMLLFSGAWTLLLLAVSGLTVLVVPFAAAAFVSFAGWATSYSFDEGYRDGARRAIEVATELAEQAKMSPEQVEQALWAAVLPPEGDGQGYLYVLEFDTGVVKIGQTNNARRRLGEHRRDAWVYNVVVTNAWISVPHAEYLANEVRLLRAIAGDHDGERAKREYFHDADFAGFVALAESLDGVSSTAVPVT